jgi:hypothetical protein
LKHTSVYQFFSETGHDGEEDPALGVKSLACTKKKEDSRNCNGQQQSDE